MTDNLSDIAVPVGTFAFHSPIQNYTISFHNGADFRNGDKVVGKLDFNGPQMKFEGNADESVDAFVRAFGHWFAGRLKQEREAEREACVSIIEDYKIPVGNFGAELACDWTYDALKEIRDIIRERGEVPR